METYIPPGSGKIIPTVRHLKNIKKALIKLLVFNTKVITENTKEISAGKNTATNDKYIL